MLQSRWTEVDDDAGERYALWSTLLHLGVESLTVVVESCEEPPCRGVARSWKVWPAIDGGSCGHGRDFH